MGNLMVPPDNNPKPQRGDAARRARLRRQILSGVAMFDAAELVEFLGVGTIDASPSSRSQRGEFLHFRIGGTTRYPAFQFDPVGQCAHASFVQILRAARAAGWSDLRLLYWMTRPHLEFDANPAASLADHGPAVLQAFLREIEPQRHG